MAKQGQTEKKSTPLFADELAVRAEQARERLAACDLCPRCCGANRLAGEQGFCGIGEQAVVASYGPHFGEESVLVGQGGSGAIFFAGCNLGCIFCQNHEISVIRNPLEAGEPCNGHQLAAIMLALQEQGCANINLVTPSHVVPQILAGLAEAVRQGLRLPVVYNTSAYDCVSTLKLLDGVVDIYMPDTKCWQPETGARYLHARDYPRQMRRALREMHRQVGDLRLDDQGLAKRGLLIRHLVLPGLLAETKAIMRFLADQISRHSFVNVMDQYHPCHRAHEFPELDRTPTVAECEQARQLARDAGLHRFEEFDIVRLAVLLQMAAAREE